MNDKASQAEFIVTQRAFMSAIRDPERCPAPADIDQRRMAVYQELFYNNVEDFLASTFPVLKEILGETGWHQLVREYFSTHRAKTPLFMQMPREFLVYLEQERESQPGDLPFMIELAHYEWTELALATSDQEITLEGIDVNGDLLFGKPVLSPLVCILGYEYAVHRICKDYLPTGQDKEETHLVVFRDRNDEVEFIEINPVTASLLHRVKEESGTGRSILADIATELQYPDPERLIEFGHSILNDMHARGVVTGVRR